MHKETVASALGAGTGFHCPLERSPRACRVATARRAVPDSCRAASTRVRCPPPRRHPLRAQAPPRHHPPHAPPHLAAALTLRSNISPPSSTRSATPRRHPHPAHLHLAAVPRSLAASCVTIHATAPHRRPPHCAIVKNGAVPTIVLRSSKGRAAREASRWPRC
ncbi:hypothetical protein PVAP13_4KG293905 [Panicum virgatum]|uniref:Uncharacterized protein n=1 Tax=Panicum virgatum TaxID=38727 RepID=A0A8T0TQX3_PANVG|nr:hypothetical protein PVAP13_4KG293905 [Panicum virgatum]